MGESCSHNRLIGSTWTKTEIPFTDIYPAQAENRNSNKVINVLGYHSVGLD